MIHINSKRRTLKTCKSGFVRTGVGKSRKMVDVFQVVIQSLILLEHETEYSLCAISVKLLSQ